MLECLDDVGTLYRVKPQSGQGPEKVFHRAELKPVSGEPNSRAPTTIEESPTVPLVSDSPLRGTGSSPSATISVRPCTRGPREMLDSEDSEQDCPWIITTIPARPASVEGAPRSGPLNPTDTGPPPSWSPRPEIPLSDPYQTTSASPPPVEHPLTPLPSNGLAAVRPMDMPPQQSRDHALPSFRRSACSSAGQHSNPHHLPRPVSIEQGRLPSGHSDHGP